jgi:hypothetical protein
MRYSYDRRTAAPRALLDPSKPLEGNAVVYFGGDCDELDPESLDLRKGEVPEQAVVKYLEKHHKDGKAKQHRPGEIELHATGWDGKTFSCVTKLKVEARK